MWNKRCSTQTLDFNIFFKSLIKTRDPFKRAFSCYDNFYDFINFLMIV